MTVPQNLNTEPTNNDEIIGVVKGVLVRQYAQNTSLKLTPFSEYKGPNEHRSIGPQYYDAKINPNNLVTYPMLAYYPTSATALNDVPLTKNVIDMDVEHTSQTDLLRKNHELQCIRAPLYGFKVPMPSSDPHHMVIQDINDPTYDDINYDTLVRTMSSAEFGRHALDSNVYQQSKKRKTNMGDGTWNMRYGLERYGNTSKNPDNKIAYSYDTSVATPITDNVRINSNSVGPSLAAIRSFAS